MNNSRSLFRLNVLSGHLVFGIVALICFLVTMPALAQGQGPVKITLDEAIQLALQHNHNLLAARTTIDQSKAQEITANFRPNPVFFTDWDYLPLFSRSQFNSTYLHDDTEADAGLSYLIERGKKRPDRLQFAKDQTAVTISTVGDNERTLTFQVASLYITVELAESTLDIAEQDLKSFQNTVDISQITYNDGRISQDDFLKIKLQLLQFQTDVAQARLARVQALSDLRNLLGYDSVPPGYDVTGPFEYSPVKLTLEDLQLKALQMRPDYRAAQQNVTAAKSGYLLAKAGAKQDLTVSGNYTHVNGINGASVSVSIPLAIFNRNQGEIARTNYVIDQTQEQQKAANEQVMTDVSDAYQGLQASDEVVSLYRGGYLDVAQQDRDISEYAYQRGAVTLLDFLDAERSYRATELAYRQALASWLLALEQLREAVGTRILP